MSSFLDSSFPSRVPLPWQDSIPPESSESVCGGRISSFSKGQSIQWVSGESQFHPVLLLSLSMAIHCIRVRGRKCYRCVKQVKKPIRDPFRVRISNRSLFGSLGRVLSIECKMVAIISTASQAQANNGANPTNNKGSITRLTRVGDRTREGHSGHKNLPCSIITEIKKGQRPHGWGRGESAHLPDPSMQS